MLEFHRKIEVKDIRIKNKKKIDDFNRKFRLLKSLIASIGIEQNTKVGIYNSGAFSLVIEQSKTANIKINIFIKR